MKNFLFLNQSFGTEGSPNQTGETLTRENRIGLMSYLRRTLMLLFAVLVMSIGQMWADETVFSATVIATENVSVAKQTTDQAITSGQATISGGSMYMSNGQEKNDKTLINTSMGPSGDKRKGFTMTNSNTMFKVVLSSALQNGDEISTVFYPNSGSDGNGLWFSTGSTIPGSAPTAKATTSSVSAWTDISYTVSTGDGICGETAFYIYRATSTSTTFQNFTITRASTTKYTLAYDANGGTGSMPSHEFVSGTTVYAGQNAGFTPPTGKIFKCWNTEAEGGGTEYKEGDSFTLSANTTLYAQWITASTSDSYCINMYDLSGGASNQMKYFTYSGYDDMQILDLEVPNYKTDDNNNFWVGAGGSWKSGDLGNSGANSANEKMKELCLKGNRGQKLGTGSQGVLARFFVYDNSWQNNLYIEFTPKQYSLIWGPDGSSWSPVKLYPSGYENEWTSEVVTLTSDQISSYNYYVGILKADNGVAYWYKSNTLSVGSMGTYNKPSDSWGGNVSTLSAGDKGFFRMWQNATGYDNWRCHFVPVYTLSYNANSGTGAPANAYTATEGDATARTLKVSTTEPTRNGYSFEGWAESSANASAGTVDYAPGASITLSADQELWAVWECVDPTIGTDLSESQVDKYVGDASPTLTVAATAAGGSVSYQWYSNTAKSTTSPTPTALTTGASYSPSTAAAGTTYYFCKITNSTAGCSNEVYSKIAKIVVSRINPTQYTVSGTASICAGGNTDITLSGSQVGASYQLKIGGSATGDAKTGTGSALTWNVSATGTYTVSAVQTTKYLARDMSGSATVSSKTATSVSFSDYTLDATEGESFEITGISAAGSGTLTYQWYSYTDAEGSGEDDIDGATSSTYTFTPASTGDYYFKCKVTGDCGSVKSDMITVTAATACSKPADPDGLSAGSISSSGVTFTITDDANTNNYEIYYSTSSTAPTGSTEASTTATSKTPTVSGLTASTTYYAWVRSVCDEDNKSDWVVLTGSTFTTSAAPATYYLFTPTNASVSMAHTGELSGVFYTGQSVSNQSGTISTIEYSKGIKFGGQLNSLGYTNTYFLKYDVRSTKSIFTVAATGGSFIVYQVSDGGTSTYTTYDVTSATTNTTFTITSSAIKTIYIGATGGNTNVKILQIKVEESGTIYKRAGEIGYSVSFVDGRLGGASGNDVPLDGMTIHQAQNYTPASSDNIKLSTNNTDYISFTTTAACQLSVTTNASSKAYYVASAKNGTTNETSATGTSTFNLAAGTWYINPKASSVYVTALSFSAAASTYTVSIAANPAGYGTVSAASVTNVASGTTLSTSTNTLSVGATNVTASATSATAEYTYAFSNWTKSDGTALPLTVTADLSVYANFTRTANNYTLAWNTNGGSDLDCDGCTSGSTAYGTAITAPNDPTLSNYTFDGWNTANDGSGSAAAATMPAANTTYYAAWKQTVTLTTGAQGSGDNQTPYVYLNGTGVSSFTPHTASGYTLQGYYTAGSGGVKVLNANGTFAGSNVTDYITSGKWSRTGAAPTLYAQWLASEDCSTSDFVIKKGSSKEFEGCMESSSYDGTATSFTAGSPTTVGNANMTISNYSDGGIKRPGSGNTFSIVIEPLSGYYLKSVCWAGKVEDDETVSYYWDDNSSSAITISPTTTSGTGVTYNAPSSTTKFTASYTDDGDGSGGIWWRNVQVEVCAAGGTTYSVTYDDNGSTGGTAPTDNTDYSYGDPVTVKDNGTLAKTEYTFAGWTTNNDGTGSSYVEDNTFSITANTTLYAKWTQAVTFDANTSNHGSTGGSATAVWNATGLTGITHATPASGYKLTGYYTDATEGTKVLNSDGTFASSNVTDYITSGKWSRTGGAPTLYAQYESAGALTWNLIVNSDTANLSTSTKTSAFTEISTTNMTDAALTGLTYSKGKKSSLTGKISTPDSYNADKYVYVTFQVASGYKFIPSSIAVKVQPVGENEHKAVELSLADATNTLASSSPTKCDGTSSGKTTTVTLAGNGTYFTGTVTLKIYVYADETASATTNNCYRLGTPIEIQGAIEAACATMPSYTSMSYTTTSFLPSADASGSPITIVGGENINTYQWKYNTVNDRTSGTNCGTNNASLTPLTDAIATTDGTRYYWCEMTNEACGITIKSPAVAITVAAAKSDATVAWTDPASTPNYGGGGYTIKAMVNETGWDGNAADLVITAPAGINIYNVTSGTTSNQKWVQASFDVTTAFDRETYSSNIPFTVSAAATASYNAISNDHNVSYSACTGGAASEELMPVNVDSVNSTVKGWRFIGTGKMWFGHGSSTPSTGSSNIKSLDNTMADGAINKYYNSGGSYFSFYTEKAITGVRLYVYTSNSNVKVSNVYIANSQFATGTPSSGAVTYEVVYNDDNEGLDKGDNVYSAWAEITFDSEVAAGKYGLIKLDNNVKIAGIGLLSNSGSGASLNTHLQWSGDLEDGDIVSKSTNDAYFTYSASKITENTNTLGAITYSSSNTSVATVDATGKVALVAAGSTIIKATLAASGCYKKAEISYTLNVSEPVCSIAAGTLTLTSGTESKCSSANVTLTLTGFESGASIQWKDGDTDINNGGNYTIAKDGTTSTLTTNQPGTYSVMVTSGCSVRSNRITISNKSTEVGAKRIVKNWYIKNGRLTPDIELWTLQNGAHLSSVAWSPANTTGLADSDFYESDGKVYLKGKEPSSNTSGVDKDYTLTLTVEDDCGSTTAMSASGQLIYLHHQKNTDKHVLAFVVTGTEKGGFTEGITAAQTTSVELYNTIAANFDVLATNVYSTDDEQALKEYYSQFDILCVTDYPNTGTKGVNKKSYVDALGALVDIRPILTMEAFVAKLANWKAKGISGTPQSPTTRQYSMLLQCKDHEIFAGTKLTKVGEGDETMYRVSMVCDTLEDYKTLDATYGGGEHAEKSGYEYGSKPALQGFTFNATMAADGLLPLGLIDDGAGNDLQVGIERQAEMSARLMVLGINGYAMERLTDDGQTVVVNALKYLMKKKEEEIADCSITFIGGDETKPNDWETASNWKGGQKPDKTTREIRILAPVVITSGQNIHAQAPIKIASGGTYNDGADKATGKITIEAGGALRADGEIQAVTAPAYSKARPTSVGDIHIKSSSENGNGTLIFKNDEGTSQAIVEMYSKASFNGGSVSWQYIAVPFATTETAYENYYGSWLYRWAEDCSGWEVIPNRGDVGPWIGYCITQVGTKTYTMTGKLVETTTQEFSVPANKEMVIGNSWTAPIQVKQFTDDDFSGLDANVYLFNTGLDSTRTGGDAETRYQAGTYVTIPIHSSPYTGDSLVSSLQAFFVKNESESEATLTLDYDRHVRPTRATDKVNAGQMHAPVRRAVVADGKPEVLKLFVSGSRYDDRLVVLAREDFSAGFDNGWDGQNINEQGDAPMMYALREDGTRDAVSAVPEFEGTVVGFQAGEDDVYTMSFVYAEEAEPLYILDTDNETYTRVLTDNTYTFMTSDKDAHSRFVLTRTSGMRNPTGCENVDGSVKAKKFILNDKMYIMVNGVMYDATGKLVK